MKYKYNLFLFTFFIFLFSPKSISSTNHVKLPLKIVDYPTKEELSSIDVYNLLIKLSKVRLQTNIIIGSNKQILPCDISFEHYPLYVSSILCEENIIKFNQGISSSFINYDKIEGYNLNQNCLRCNISKDYLYFNNDDNNKGIPLTFILGSMLQTEFNTVSAEIGFRPTKPKKDPGVLNILLQLKRAKIISNKNFFFHLNINELNGDLLLGAYNEKFFHNENKFKHFYISAENGNIQDWEFLLDNAYYGKKYICDRNKVVLSLKQYFIYVPYYMKQILDNDFFKELSDKKLCELVNLNKSSTNFYVCDDSIDINKMKNFSFFPINLNEPIEFVLSPKDLFVKFGKNKLLYIIGFNYGIDYWKFNLPFIMKYQPIFDIDNKIISVYNDLNLFSEDDFNSINNDIDNPSTNNETKEKGKKIYVNKIVYFILSLFLILILMIITKKLLYCCKIKMQEERENKEGQLLEFQEMRGDNNEDSQDKDDNSSEKYIIN